MEHLGKSHSLDDAPSESIDLGDLMDSEAKTADAPAPLGNSRRELKTLRNLGYRYCNQCERIVLLQIVNGRRDSGSSFFRYVSEHTFLSLIVARAKTSPVQNKKIWGCPYCGQDYRRLKRVQKKHFLPSAVRQKRIPRRYLILMTSVPIIALISVPMIAYRVRMYALLPKSDQDRPPGRSPSDSPPMIVRDTRPLTPRVAETLEKQVIQAPGENPRPDRPARESPTRIDFLAEGRTSYAKGDYDRAIVAYNEFIRLEPQDPIGYRELGLSRLGKKQYDRAIHDFDDAIARNPQFAIAYNDRGLAKFRKGQYDTAIDDFTNAISFNPQFFQAYDNRGLVRHHKGQNYKGNEQRFLYIDAVGDFTDAININGRYADAYRHRAAVLRALRNFSLAGEDEDTAKRLDPR